MLERLACELYGVLFEIGFYFGNDKLTYIQRTLINKSVALAVVPRLKGNEYPEF